jgi:hypothetical protein
MASPWFSQSDDSPNQPSGTMAPTTTEPTLKKSSRLSATFGSDSRPWNFMTSSSDRSSSSSRKRLSLFGGRSSTASSTDTAASSHSSPRNSVFVQQQEQQQQHQHQHQHQQQPQPQPSRPQLARSQSRFSIDSKSPALAVTPTDSWRSSIFSRRRSSKSTKGTETKDEPFTRRLRSDNRASSWRREYSDFYREHESEEACKSSARIPLTYQD